MTSKERFESWKQQRKARRGEVEAGGKVVGVSKGGILWVAYEGQDYQAMCDLFDRTQ